MSSTEWVRQIPNTSGDIEREAKSRRYNLIEPFLMMTIVLVDLWFFEYPFGVLRKIELVNTISRIILTCGALYILFVSPFIHKDSLTSWGLGDPRQLWRMLREGALWRRLLLGTIVTTLTLVLAAIAYVEWPEVAKFLFSFKSETALSIKATIAGKAAIVSGGLLLSLFLTTCVIRYDNFASAFLTALKVTAVLAALLYLLAFGMMGARAFSDFNASEFGLNVFGYVFWGALQQLLFSSYFGTRIRKGIAPASDPNAVWKKRLWVAVLNGSFFGLIHINSWSFVMFTWILGVILSWYFMRDSNRNLIALGFIHGFLGSSVGWLFRAEKAGKGAVSMGVGPSHVHGFDPLTMVIVTILIIAFIVVIIRIKPDKPENSN